MKINETLCSAIRLGNLNDVIKLLNDGANADYIDEYKQDTLFYAVVYCRFDILKYLYENGASLTKVYKNKRNILQIAIESECEKKGFFSIIKWLIDKGVSVNQKDKHGNTALLDACTFDFMHNIQTINYLLDNNAKGNIENEYGISVCSFAAQYDMKELISILEKKGGCLAN